LLRRIPFFVKEKKPVTLYCSKRQFAFDVGDVHVLKFGHTDSNLWVYFVPKCMLLRTLCSSLVYMRASYIVLPYRVLACVYRVFLYCVYIRVVYRCLQLCMCKQCKIDPFVRCLRNGLGSL